MTLRTEQEIHTDVSNLASAILGIADRGRRRLKSVVVGFPDAVGHERFLSLLDTRLRRAGVETSLAAQETGAERIQIVAVEFDVVARR